MAVLKSRENGERVRADKYFDVVTGELRQEPIVERSGSSASRMVLIAVGAAIVAAILAAGGLYAYMSASERSSELSQTRQENRSLEDQLASATALGTQAEDDLGAAEAELVAVQDELASSQKALGRTKKALKKAQKNAKAQYERGVTAGKAQGYADGRSDGAAAAGAASYSDGWDDGYSSGYDAGWYDCSAALC